jgi:hypothetical protein
VAVTQTNEPFDLLVTIIYQLLTMLVGHERLVKCQQVLGALVACRSEIVTTNAAGGVGVFPLKGLSVG